MAPPRVSALALFGLAAVYGCSSGDTPSSPIAPAAETPPPVAVTNVPRVELTRGRARGMARYEFKPTAGGWTATPERDRMTFDGHTLAVENSDTGASIGLSTDYVGRGSNLLVGVPEEVVDDSGVIHIQRGPVTETLRGERFGTSQSWNIAQKPAGTSDLVFRVGVTGVTSADNIPDVGLHLVTADGEFLYTMGGWVDANGVTTVVEPHLVGSSIEMKVPAAVVDASAYPAVMDPLVGTYVAGQPRSYAANIASNGTNYLVAYEDYSTANGATLAPSVKIKLIPASGTVPATGTAVSTSAVSVVKAEPAVAFDGINYIVAWREGQDVKFISVNATTGALIGTPLAMSSGGGNQYSPSIACSPSPRQCIGVWQNTAGKQVNYQQLVAPSDGAALVIDANHGAKLSTTSNVEYAPVAASDGANRFLVVWEQLPSVTAVPPLPQYATLGATSVIFGANTSKDVKATANPLVARGTGTAEVYSPPVAFSGTANTFMVTYTSYDTTVSAFEGAQGRLVTTTGTTDATTRMSASSASPLGLLAADIGNTTIGCLGSTCYAAYWTNDNLLYTSASASGGLMVFSGGGTLSGAAASQENPHLAVSSGGAYGVYDDHQSGWWVSHGSVLGGTPGKIGP